MQADQVSRVSLGFRVRVYGFRGEGGLGLGFRLGWWIRVGGIEGGRGGAPVRVTACKNWIIQRIAIQLERKEATGGGLGLGCTVFCFKG